MGKQALTSLARFCASQRNAFELRAWLGERTIDRRDLAIAALYLSMTSWYGYEGSLERIAEELHPGIASGGVFSAEMSAMDFDLACFSATTRYLIHQSRD